MACAVICHFYAYEYRHLMHRLNAATGWQVTRDGIVTAGTCAITMGRLFLVREGFTASTRVWPMLEFQAPVIAL